VISQVLPRWQLSISDIWLANTVSDKILDHDPDILLEGFVEFQSPTTFVSVAGEWYGVEVTLRY
jgi:hypothetical protein